jgi:glutaredoxin-related protein
MPRAYGQSLAPQLQPLYSRSASKKIDLDQLVHTIQSSELVILYSPWCGYSKNALQLLNKNHISHTSIDFDHIGASMDEIRQKLSRVKSLQFPASYSTRPIVFINGEFIGGYNELRDRLS